MTRIIIAALVSLGIVGSIATSASAHRPTPKPQPAAEQQFDAAKFWQQQSERSGQ